MPKDRQSRVDHELYWALSIGKGTVLEERVEHDYYNYFIIMNYFTLNPHFSLPVQQSPQSYLARSSVPIALVIRSKNCSIQQLQVPLNPASPTIKLQCRTKVPHQRSLQALKHQRNPKIKFLKQLRAFSRSFLKYNRLYKSKIKMFQNKSVQWSSKQLQKSLPYLICQQLANNQFKINPLSQILIPSPTPVRNPQKMPWK